MASAKAIARLWLSLHPAAIGLSGGVVIIAAIMGLITPFRSEKTVAQVVDYGFGISRYGKSESWVSLRFRNGVFRAPWPGGSECPNGNLVTVTRSMALISWTDSVDPRTCRPF
jgi:hypothetical protein